MRTISYLATLAIVAGGLATGCDKDDTTIPTNNNAARETRTAGQNAKDGAKDLVTAGKQAADQAADKTADATRDAVDATGRGVAKTGDAIERSAEKAADVTRDAVDATGHAVREAGREMRDAATTRPTTLPTTRPMSSIEVEMGK
jgi:hypothetical protein